MYLILREEGFSTFLQINIILLLHLQEKEYIAAAMLFPEALIHSQDILKVNKEEAI